MSFASNYQPGVCRLCGDPKIPFKKCIPCWAAAHARGQTKAQNKTEKMRQRVGRKKKPETIKRNNLINTLFEILACFELNEQGRYVLYQDRMENDLEPILLNIRRSMKSLKKLQDFKRPWHKAYMREYMKKYRVKQREKKQNEIPFM